MKIPKGILIWIFISNVIVFIDGFFVIFRPETLKGGKYYSFFFFYENYYKFDTLYLRDDRFLTVQSWMNWCEAFLSLIAVGLSICSCQTKRTIGAILCIVVSVMVVWKAVMLAYYNQ